MVHTLAGVLAGAAIVLLTLAWLLSRGPISLGFIAPYVGDLINQTLPEVEADFDDTILSWEGWERAVDLRVINLNIRSDEEKVLAQIPEVAFSVSTKALLRGVIAPSRVELFGPTVYAVRETDGRLNLAFAGAGAMATGRLEPFLNELTKASDPDDPLSYLKQIDISDADLIIEDTGRGRSWVTPDTQISLRRDGARVDGETSFLVDLDGDVAEISLVGAYDASTRRIDAGLSFGGVTPSVLAGVSPEIGFLKYIDVPVQGTITIAASVDGVLESIGFDVSGAEGVMHLPAPLEGSLQTESFSLSGHFDAGSHQLELAELSAQLAPDSRLYLPAPVDHSFPVSGFTTNASYDGGSDLLKINDLEMDLSGIQVSTSGTISQLTNQPHIVLRAGMPQITIAQSRDYWPRTVGTDAYNWFSTQVKSGTIKNLSLELDGTMDGVSDFRINKAEGKFDVRKAVIRYADAMPLVTEFDATALFKRDRIDFEVTRAHSEGLDLEIGAISLTELTGDTEHANITTVVTGPFRKAVELIDKAPLDVSSIMDISSDRTAGVLRTELVFDFPLKKALTWIEVDASAQAELEAVTIPEGLFGLDVDEGRLELDINNDGMSIAGELLLENFPTVLTWRRNFKENTSYKNRYEMTVHVTDVQNITDLGIDVSPFSADMIRGEVPLNVHVTETHDGITELEARASLDGVIMAIPAINWYKEEKESGEARVSIELKNNTVTAIPKFAIETGNLAVEGAAYYASDSGKLNRIELSNVVYGRTNMSALLVPGVGDSWDANFTGNSLDLDPVWEDIVFGDFTESGQSFLENVSVSANFERVWLSDDRGLDNVIAAFARENEVMRTVYVTSEIKNGAPLEIKMTPSDLSNSRILTVWSSDAGEVLRTFDLYDLMVGGELSMTGQIDDARENRPFNGLLDIQHYRIIEAPALARLVSLMALTGILEALQGEGLAFDTLKMPFEYADGAIQLTDAKATGASLGFTASGVVYTHADAVDINGTVVPVYALNSVLGNIPLLGNILTGGEKGGGIFAANYTMTGPRSDPDVSVNALSALAPGFLRNLFNIFEGSGSAAIDPEQNRSPSKARN